MALDVFGTNGKDLGLVRRATWRSGTAELSETALPGMTQTVVRVMIRTRTFRKSTSVTVTVTPSSSWTLGNRLQSESELYA